MKTGIAAFGFGTLTKDGAKYKLTSILYIILNIELA